MQILALKTTQILHKNKACGKALVFMVTASLSRVDLRPETTVIVSQMIFGTTHSGWNGGRKVSGSVESLEVLIAVQVVKVQGEPLGL